MDQSLENKPEFKDRLINFYNLNKVKFIFLVILLIIISSTIFIKIYNKKKNILIAEKYVKQGYI